MASEPAGTDQPSAEPEARFSQSSFAQDDFETAMKMLDHQASQMPEGVIERPPLEFNEGDDVQIPQFPFGGGRYELSDEDNEFQDVSFSIPRRLVSPRVRTLDLTSQLLSYKHLFHLLGLPVLETIFEHGLTTAIDLVDDPRVDAAYGSFDLEKMYKFSIPVFLFLMYRYCTNRTTAPRALTETCGCYYATALTYFGLPNDVAFEQEIRDTEALLKRKKFLDTSWYMDFSVRMEDPPCDAHARKWLDTFHIAGRLGLTDLIIEQEKDCPYGTLWKTVDMTDPERFKKVRTQIVLMLCTEDDAFIESCITRQIARHRTIRGHPVRSIIKTRQNWVRSIPCQYVNIICDRIGIPPTVQQCDQVRQDILLYLSDGAASDEIAMKIDFAIKPPNKWTPRLVRQGLRRYPDMSEIDRGLEQKNTRRRQLLDQFLRKLDERLKPMLMSKQHRPLDQPFVEIGYTKNPTARLEAHASHRNSNYIMNLVQAAFEARYPRRFILHQHVINPSQTPWQTWFGEVCFTRMMNGYIKEAGGFSHHPAGYSNGSAYRRLEQRQWDRIYRQIRAHTNLSHNIKAEDQKAEELSKQIAELDSREEALDALGRVAESSAELANLLLDFFKGSEEQES